jgi:hypothetical protein
MEDTPATSKDIDLTVLLAVFEKIFRAHSLGARALLLSKKPFEGFLSNIATIHDQVLNFVLPFLCND